MGMRKTSSQVADCTSISIRLHLQRIVWCGCGEKQYWQNYDIHQLWKVRKYYESSGFTWQ